MILEKKNKLFKGSALIDYIKIYGLHNEMDISLDFSGSAKIIIGDNGSGKTTVLNALYYILTKNFTKLIELNFKKIDFKFKDSDSFIINKKDLYVKLDVKYINHPILKKFSKDISRSELSELLSHTYSSMHGDSFISEIEKVDAFQKLVKLDKHAQEDILGRLHYIVEKYMNENSISKNSQHQIEFFNTKNQNNISSISETISNNVKGRVLYLPTYRRVEEAIKNFDDFDDESISKNSLIKFGMEDVEKRFKKIQRELKDSAVKLYTNLNGKMLTQLTSTHKAQEEDFLKIENTDALKIVFARVGDSIERDTEDNILLLIESGDIRNERYHPLVFVLSNLLDVYEEQKETDKSIKSFIRIANKYLVKKEFIYNENNVEISIINKKSKNIVTLENLSSGEKQLLSLFSLLYLEKEDDYLVIFDEPELSLSIEWQEMLLPDMLASNKCRFLVAATHSPFIFNNELDSVTGIIEIMKEYS